MPPTDTVSTERLFRDWLLRESAHVDTRIVLQMQRIISPSIREIFVPLTASEVRSESPADNLTTRELASVFAKSRISKRPPGELLEERQRELVAIRTTPVQTRLPLAKILASDSQSVIQGDPGSGKSTLLKWIVQELLHPACVREPALKFPRELLPVPITLRYFASRLDESSSPSLIEDLRDAAWRREFGDDAPAVGAFVRRAAAEGGCLFLLDGLDEAINATMRRRIVSAINELAFRFRRCRFLVTSRVVGYELAPLPSAWRAWKLDPFGPDQIRDFIEKWSLLIERQEDLPAFADTPDAFVHRRAQQRTTELQDSLGLKPGAPPEPQKDRVRGLASNPMLCTLIGLIHHQGRRLPDDRAQLYRLCLEAFVYDWEIQKRLKNIERQSLDKEETLEVLEELAWQMHNRVGTNTLSAEALGETIKTFLTQEKGYAPARAQERVANQIELIRDRVGLLIERGEEEYGFAHLQFQEYLAGRALVRHRKAIPKLLRERLWQSRWREPILLAAAHCVLHSEEVATEYIQAVRNTPPPGKYPARLHLEDLLHHAFFTALRCASDARKMHFKLRQSLLDQASELFDQKSRGYLWGELAQAIGRHNADLDSGRLVEWLRDKDGDVRYHAASALRKLDEAAARQPEVVNRLVEWLRDKDDGVRYSAVLALGNLGEAAARRPEVVRQLVECSRDTNNNVRSRAAEALGKLGEAATRQPDVVSRLVECLRDKDFSVHYRAALALGKLGEAVTQQPEVVNRLAEWLRDKDDAARYSAALALGNLGDAVARQPEVVRQLVECLRDSNNNVRSRSAEALGKLGEAVAWQPDVVSRLVECLRHEDYGVRYYAAEALGNLGEAGAGQPEVISRLVEWLRDKNEHVRSSAAEALGNLGKAVARQPEVVNRLVECLRDEDDTVRSSAASALGNLGEAVARQPEVVRRLVECSRSTNDALRSRAVKALGKLGEAVARQPEVVRRLVEYVRDTNGNVRSLAAEALGNLGEGVARQPEVVRRLVECLRDENLRVCYRAAEALGRLKAERAVKPMAELLADSNTKRSWPALDNALREILLE